MSVSFLAQGPSLHFLHTLKPFSFIVYLIALSYSSAFKLYFLSVLEVRGLPEGFAGLNSRSQHNCILLGGPSSKSITCFLQLLETAFTFCTHAPFLHLQGWLLSILQSLSLILLSSCYNDACDDTVPIQIIQDNLPSHDP